VAKHYHPRHARKTRLLRLVDWVLEAVTGEVPIN
jgi:hypothetical protein